MTFAPRPRRETAAAADDDGRSKPTERCREPDDGPCAASYAYCGCDGGGTDAGLVERVRCVGRDRGDGSTLGGQHAPEVEVDATGVLDPPRDGAAEGAAASASGLNIKLTDSFGRVVEAVRGAAVRVRKPAVLLLLLAAPDDDEPAAESGGYECQSERSSAANWGCCDGRFHWCIVRLREYEMMSRGKHGEVSPQHAELKTAKTTHGTSSG